MDREVTADQLNATVEAVPIVAKLMAQIEALKCCGNCEHWTYREGAYACNVALVEIEASHNPKHGCVAWQGHE